MDSHSPLPWFIRHCDDEHSMNMTVISSKDYGDWHSGRFNNEPDTVAIVFHQLIPQVGCDSDDFGDDNAALICEAVNNHAKLKSVLGWFVGQFQGDSGTGHTHWVQFEQYREACKLLGIDCPMV